MEAVQIIVVMGVAGAGKSTVGRQLAGRLGWVFLDADDFHPPANILKMTAGQPLTDADRAPWLSSMHSALAQAQANGRPVVLAASVLKESYRQRLAAGLGNVHYVYLSASAELIAGRLNQRSNHFMKADMLVSQFAALEEPVDALAVDAGLSPVAIIDIILPGLGLSAAPGANGRADLTDAGE